MNSKTRFGVTLLFLFLTTCSSCINGNDSSILLLGNWRGVFEENDGGDVYNAEYIIQFLPFNIFIFNRIAPEEIVRNEVFRYEIIGDRVAIKGRINDEMEITKDDDYLVINSLHNFLPNGRYSRIPPSWSWLSLAGLIIILLTTLFKKSWTKRFSPNLWD